MSNTLFEITHWLENVSFVEFKKEIEEKLIGQEELTLVLSQVYSYLDSIVYDRPINHNMIIAAPSGSGKTETYRVLKQYFKRKIPSLVVSICDVSQVTASGFKGMEPTEIINDFFRQNSSIGLCFLDEFDKKLIPSYTSQGDNISAEAQSNLLTIIEGIKLREKSRIVDTSNIMFIGMGSFNDFRSKHENTPAPIGFDRKNDSPFDIDVITKESIIDSGGLYELVGRFPIIVNYNKLNEASVKKVIKKIAQNISNTYNCDISIKPSFEAYLVKNAFSKFGCRLIDSIIREAVLREYAKSLTSNFDINDTLVITLKDNGNYSHKFIKDNKIKEEYDY